MKIGNEMTSPRVKSALDDERTGSYIMSLDERWVHGWSVCACSVWIVRKRAVGK